MFINQSLRLSFFNLFWGNPFCINVSNNTTHRAAGMATHPMTGINQAIPAM
jgi:hypothetical protein